MSLPAALPMWDEFRKVVRHRAPVMSDKDAPHISRFFQYIRIRNTLQARFEAREKIDGRLSANEVVKNFSVEIVIRDEANFHRRVVRRSSFARISRS